MSNINHITKIIFYFGKYEKIINGVVLFWNSVNQQILTKNEKTVLYGMTVYPALNDSELSDILNVKLSTLTSIKRRLTSQGYYRTLMIPLVNRLGCELLAITYMQFNPVIPLQERLETTKQTIEVFDEIFFSIGEEEKGFSISLSQNYTNIGRINDKRTETFGKLGLLEKEYPHEAIFPFKTSIIHRFFDCATVLEQLFDIHDVKTIAKHQDLFRDISSFELSQKEKKVYISLVEHPTETTQQIGQRVGLSRHTVARMKKKFIQERLMQQFIIPNLKLLGIEILSFYHIRFNPHNAPNTTHLADLNSPSTIFYVTRKFEACLLSAYATYQEYKVDQMNKIRFLKENNLFSHPPFISTYMYNRMEVIKEFSFAPLIRKVLEG